MTDRLDGTDLAALHQAIVDVSAAAFPGVHFEFYRQDRKNLPFGSGAPGQDPRAYALMELEDFEAGDSVDPGTEQLAMRAKFSCEFVVKSLPLDARLSVRVLAASFAAFLRKQVRFRPEQILQGQAMVMGVYKDDFSPELDQFEVWRVDWAQEIWLGTGDIWKPLPGATTPSQVLFSYEPATGIPNEPQYQDITGIPRA